MKVYIYNENCVRKGDVVPNHVLDQHEDPDNGGDWTLYEGTREELAELAREEFRHAGLDLFRRKVARNLAAQVDADLEPDEEEEEEDWEEEGE